MVKTLLLQEQNSISFRNASSDRAASVVVWSIWLVMLLAAFFCVHRYGRDIPLAEDWLMVAPLTGHEQHLADWFWAQNNEHRVPLPKLIFLLLLKLTGGDFRSGMYLNAIMLGGIAFAMIVTVRKVRGGRTKLVDALFPVTLLHIGNWENLVWSWQLSFVFPMVLIFGVLICFVLDPGLEQPRNAFFFGFSLLLLPLCGGIGLLFVPFLSLWVLYCGYIHWSIMKSNRRQKIVSGFLLLCATLAMALIGLYFIGYIRPTWNPPSPNLKATLFTAGKFLALSFGPAVSGAWKPWILAALLVLAVGFAAAARNVLTREGQERNRALGLTFFFGILTVFALAMGWGRAGLVPLVGMPIRYVLLAVPVLFTTFFVFELYGSRLFRNIVQWSLLAVMLVLVPFNTSKGFEWRNWYLQGMVLLEKDLATGMPVSQLSKKHKEFLIHWWNAERLEEHILMLKNSQIGPFTKTQNN